jgi:Tfp pilus assembly protein PilF
MILVKALARICGFGRQTSARTPEEGARAAIAAYELLQRSDISGAEALLAPFLGHEPDHADVLLVQGLVHKQRRELERAAACFRKATALRQGFAAAWSQLGTVLKDSEKPDEALAAFEQACALEPQSAALHQNCGLLRYQLRNVGGAIQSLTTALSLDPDMREAHFDLAEALLAAGDFERGWPEYEHRPHVARDERRAHSGWSATFRPPRRDHSQQGLGDSCLPEVAAEAPNPSTEPAVFVQPALVRLVRESGLADAVLSSMKCSADRYDAYLPLMSLALATSLRVSDLGVMRGISQPARNARRFGATAWGRAMDEFESPYGVAIPIRAIAIVHPIRELDRWGS